MIPVVVDFWAEWCGPCRALTPALEKAANEREGKVELAKLDTDANPNLARSFAIQGIPAVMVFKDGHVVDEFVGAQPPVVVERFMDGLVPSEAETLAAVGDEESLRKALELEPGRASGSPGSHLHDRGETEEALAVLEPVRESFQADGWPRICGSSSPATRRSRRGCRHWTRATGSAVSISCCRCSRAATARVTTSARSWSASWTPWAWTTRPPGLPPPPRKRPVLRTQTARSSCALGSCAASSRDAKRDAHPEAARAAAGRRRAAAPPRSLRPPPGPPSELRSSAHGSPS